MCKDHIVLAITALNNNCIGQGIFPDKLKIASVIPLHKDGDINDKLSPYIYLTYLIKGI